MSSEKTAKPKKSKVGFLSSIIAVIIGLLVGFIILLICNPQQAAPGFFTILTGSFTHGLKGVGQIFYYATPIILTGLSVGFAFNTGLFNIGAPGQFMVGGLGAVVIGITCTFFGPFQWVAALLGGFAMGMLWGAVPGLLKAYFNVNEVIASIMMNYIGMYLTNWTVKSTPALFNSLRNESKSVAVTANLPKMGFDKLFPGSSLNAGFVIAVIAVVFIWVLLYKTKFGYELKACGYNRFASKYAGINEKKNIMMAMVIAGALSGLAGAIVMLAGSGSHISIKDVIASEGFTGISVALLGLSHPFGVLAAGIFIAYLTAGGFYLQLFQFSTEIIDIIVAVIIYFSAFALFVKMLIARFSRKKEETGSTHDTGGSGAANVSPGVSAMAAERPEPKTDSAAGQKSEEGGDNV